ncbi:hypothetical protein [Dietzia sp.]
MRSSLSRAAASARRRDIASDRRATWASSAAIIAGAAFADFSGGRAK